MTRAIPPVTVVREGSAARKALAHLCCHRLAARSGGVVLPATSERLVATIHAALAFLGADHRTIRLDDALDELGDPELASPGLLGRGVAELYAMVQRVNAPADLQAAVENGGGRGLVVAVGRNALDQACMASWLSGKPVLLAAGDPDVVDLFGSTVRPRSYTLATDDGLTVTRLTALLAAKKDADNRAPIGFLYPFDADNRENVVVKNHLYAALPTLAGPDHYFYPLERGRRIDAVPTGVRVIGGHAGEVKRLLTTDAEWTFSTLHSNGADMDIGDVVVCARGDVPGGGLPSAAGPEPVAPVLPGDAGARCLPCFHGEGCSRVKPSRAFIAPSDIRTKILLAYTCWGICLADHPLSVESTLAYQFAASPYVAAFVSTYTLSLLDRDAGPFMTDSYHRGSTIGEAVQAYNERHHERFGDRFDAIVVFGDPDLRGPVTPQPDAAPTPLARRTPPGDDGRARFSGRFDAKYLTHLAYAEYLVDSTAEIGLPGLAAQVEEARAAIRALRLGASIYASRLAQPQFYPTRALEAREASHGDLVAAYQRAMAAFYVRQCQLLGGYVRPQVDKYFDLPPEDPDVAPTACPYCAAPLEFHRKRLHLARIEKYQLECLNCSTIADGCADLAGGELLTPSTWHRSTPIEVAARVRVAERRGVPRRVGVDWVLEPYVKGAGAPVMTGCAEAPGATNDEVTVATGSVVVPEHEVRGMRYLNAIVTIEESLVFLRRTVYVA